MTVSHSPLPLRGRGKGGVESPKEAPRFIDSTPTEPSPVKGEGITAVQA